MKNQSQQEPTTQVDALEASLHDLLKAADATDLADKLIKGSGIETGTGDSLAGPGDAGSLEDMMIAKMSEAGYSVDAGTAASLVGLAASFFDKMKGKAFGEPDADGDEDEEEEQVGKRKGGAVPIPGMQKSFAQTFRDDDDISKAVDVSPFLEAIAARTSEGLDSLSKSQRAIEKKGDRFQKAAAIAIVQVGSLVKSQQAIIAELGRRLGIAERQPMQAKGVTGTARPLNKSMPGEIGPGAPQPLQKNEFLSVLSFMNIRKSMREIAGMKTSDIISKANSNAPVPQDAVDAVQLFLKTNPQDAVAARSFLDD